MTPPDDAAPVPPTANPSAEAMARRPEPGISDAAAIFAPGLFGGQVAVITGGGTGIGRESAVALARLGADVVLVGRRPEPLEETRAEIESLGRAALVVPTNIRNPDEVDALCAAAYERFGRVDVLVNNAGGQFPALPSEISDNGWRAVVDLNLNGTWNMVSRFMGPMAEAGRGAIINVVHVFSFDRGAPWFVHSGAARAGVVNMTHTMAPYLGYHGVTINALAPGTVATAGMHENEAGQVGYDEDAWAVVAEEVGPMRRMGSAGEMAAIIAFLASPGGRFINGAAIVADGGESQSNWLNVFERGAL